MFLRLVQLISFSILINNFLNLENADQIDITGHYNFRKKYFFEKKKSVL